ncbi:Amino-acid acetyltransferase, mitochondrial, partial [Coemansia sp. RSA 1797]
MQAHGVRVFVKRAGVQLHRLIPSGQNRFSTASSASPESETGAHHKQRERELILSVLSTVPSPREARKFLNSVSGNETMRSQREFEERQARLATEEPTVRTPGQLVPGEILHSERAAETRETEAVPRRLTASVFIDGLESPGACERTGKLLAQIQRIGVSPVVLLANNGSADATCGGYRSIIRQVHQLADAVEREGGKARPINEGVFFNNPYDRTDLTVDPELIGAAIAQGHTPIISPLMADAELQVKVLKPRVAAAAVARALAQSTSTQHAMAGSGGAFSLLVARLILLGGADGLTGEGNVFHRFVNLEEDYAEVAAACAQPDVLELMRTCLAILPPTAAGIVASVDSDPSLVLKGLISERPVATQQRARRNQGVAQQGQAVRRAGIPSYRPLPSYPFVDIGVRDVAKTADVVEAPTQFTLLRHGFQIQRHKKLDTCNVPRLRSLLESSFK